MAENRAEIKSLLTQFVDQLLDSEIASVKEQIYSLKEKVTDSLEEIKGDVEQKIKEIKEETEKGIASVKQLSTDLKTEMTQVSSELKTEMIQLSSDLKSEVKELSSKVNAEMKELESGIQSAVDEKLSKSSFSVLDKLTDFEKNNSDKISELERKNCENVAKVDNSLNSLQKEIVDSLNSQTSTLGGRIATIEQRVSESEKTLEMARSDHDKVASVLSIFATNFNAVAGNEPVAAKAPSTQAVSEPQATPVDSETVKETKSPIVEESENIIEPVQCDSGDSFTVNEIKEDVAPFAVDDVEEEDAVFTVDEIVDNVSSEVSSDDSKSVETNIAKSFDAFEASVDIADNPNSPSVSRESYSENAFGYESEIADSVLGEEFVDETEEEYNVEEDSAFAIESFETSTASGSNGNAVIQPSIAEDPVSVTNVADIVSDAPEIAPSYEHSEQIQVELAVVEENPMATNMTPSNVALQTAQLDQRQEFGIDLQEVDFQATDKNPHMDVVVDESGQHIYKPY